jgi:hypothetical protein
MNKAILCPVCGQSDLVEKVSSLYISGIGLNRSASQAGLQPEGSPPTKPGVEMLGLSAFELRLLSRRLKPPSLGKGAPFRALHPDLVVLTFSLILPVFIYGIYISQKAKQRAERRISRWMKLYYCAREDIVFQPGTGKFVPADQMPGYLNLQAPDTEF